MPVRIHRMMSGLTSFLHPKVISPGRRPHRRAARARRCKTTRSAFLEVLEDRMLLTVGQLQSPPATIVDNRAPVLTPPENQSLPITQDSVDVTLVATDPDDDSLTFSAVPLPGEFYLDQTLELSFAGDFFLNVSGTLNEKWLRAGDLTWYLLTPNGDFWRWTGIGTAAQIPDNRVLVASLSTTVYDNPSLLFDAQPDEFYLDQTLGLNFTGDFFLNVSGTLNEKWLRADDLTWYFLTPNGDFWRWTGNGSAAQIPANRALVASLSSTVYDNPARLVDAVSETATVTVSGSILTVDPNSDFTGIFGVEASVSDGSLSDSKMFLVSVTPCTSPDGYGYQACIASPTFEDIRASGTGVLLSSDDGTAELTDAALGDFQFDFYGTTYANLFVSSNGLITFGSGNIEWRNADLTSSPSQATIAPLWDDLVSTGSADGIYWEVRGSGSAERLIIQWNDVNYIGASRTITFQAVLSEIDRSIQFNYLDLVGDDVSHDDGASATVGVKDVGVQGVNRLLPAFNNGPNPFVGTGSSTRIMRPPSVTLSLDHATIAENNGVATFTATLSEPSSLPVSVDLGFSGTATLNDDYTLSNGQLVFAAGATSRKFTVTAVPDTLVENNETVIVGITGVTNGTESGMQQVTTAISDNQAPLLTNPGNQTLSPTQDTLNLTLVATDPNNDPLTFGASAHTFEYYLDQTRALNFTGNFFLNTSGTLNEKWLRGDDLTWYLLTPDGNLWQWTGNGEAAEIPENRFLIASLSAAVYDNPVLLYAAQPGGAPGTATVLGSTLTIDPDPGFVGVFSIATNVSDSSLSDAEMFLVTVTSCTSTDGFGYQACVVTPTFEDIRSTGTGVLANSDDATVELTDSALGDFQFDFYGNLFVNLFVSSNGLITFESSNTEWRNTDLTSSPTQAAIAPLWDDMVTNGSADGVYWEVRGSGGNERLIIQWNDVDYIGATGKITFQAVLSEVDKSIQFNYLDLAGDDTQQDEAASATVGIKGVGVPGANRLVPAFNSSPSAFVGTGKSTRIARISPLTSLSKNKRDDLPHKHEALDDALTGGVAWLPELRPSIVDSASPLAAIRQRAVAKVWEKKARLPSTPVRAPSTDNRRSHFRDQTNALQADSIDRALDELGAADLLSLPFNLGGTLSNLSGTLRTK